eukprot:COSAG01_NODE_85_length_27670_cov_34.051467_1_plen_89_part_00
MGCSQEEPLAKASFRMQAVASQQQQAGRGRRVVAQELLRPQACMLGGSQKQTACLQSRVLVLTFTCHADCSDRQQQTAGRADVQALRV